MALIKTVSLQNASIPWEIVRDWVGLDNGHMVAWDLYAVSRLWESTTHLIVASPAPCPAPYYGNSSVYSLYSSKTPYAYFTKYWSCLCICSCKGIECQPLAGSKMTSDNFSSCGLSKLQHHFQHQWLHPLLFGKYHKWPHFCSWDQLCSVLVCFLLVHQKVCIVFHCIWRILGKHTISIVNYSWLPWGEWCEVNWVWESLCPSWGTCYTCQHWKVWVCLMASWRRVWTVCII